MANNLLLLAALGAVGCVFVIDPPPKDRSIAQAIHAASSPISYVAAGRGPTVEARQAPVPLVRAVPASPASLPAPVPETPARTAPAQDDADGSAAKAAAELDGYKRVRVIGKASNGAWRVKGYIGLTEVAITVDSSGRVSMD